MKLNNIVKLIDINKLTGFSLLKFVDVIDNGGSATINFAELVSTIKNIVSDLGPVNPLLNSQLKSLREYLIQKVLGN